MAGKIFIFSSPSGSGKSTLINYLMQQELNLHFAISATSRLPRGTEQHGIEYYFLTPEDFRNRISRGDFLEYVEVYKDKFYGTLKEQVEAQLARGESVVLDVDVIGGCQIKKYYDDRALSIFVQPPSIEELRNRLQSRGTETEEVIEERIKRAKFELSYAPQYDAIIVNDNLQNAQRELLAIVKKFLA